LILSVPDEGYSMLSNVLIGNPGITFIRYAQNQKVGKTANSKVFGSNKTKGPKQDDHNQPRLESLE
jgi:hypothetical protein